jgi:hypothetical protein
MTQAPKAVSECQQSGAVSAQKRLVNSKECVYCWADKDPGLNLTRQARLLSWTQAENNKQESLTHSREGSQ